MKQPQRARLFLALPILTLVIALVVGAIVTFDTPSSPPPPAEDRPNTLLIAPAASGRFACELAENEDGFTLTCRPLEATAEPYPGPGTETPEPTLTATATTAVPPPTVQPPTATATVPPVAGPPYPDAPLCASHDNRAYHSLWNQVDGCHYDHTHGATDPRTLDDVFGTELWDLMGGSVSYPWHTPGENDEIKHRSYQWLVERDRPCFSQFSEGCFIHYRAFVHNDLHNVVSTHHSSLIEAWVCDEARPTECGRMLVSGHHATGDLLIDNQVVLDRPEPAGAPRPVMLHYDTTGNRNFATWYPVFSSWQRISTEIGDMWGYYPIPLLPLPVEPGDLTFVPLPGNASRVQPHVISVGFSRANLLSIGVDPGIGRVSYNGFLDVHTAVPGDCLAIGEHCAPLIIEDVPNLGQFQHRGLYQEFDICFDSAGEQAACNNSGSNSSGWLTFPGFVTSPPAVTPEATPTVSALVAPYPDAPLCPDSGESHDNSLFHTLWDGARGCHYDHEHGEDPFTAQVAAAFPGFDLVALLGGVEIGHTNLSSPMENTHKHGGFKWDVVLSNLCPNPDFPGGFEGAQNCVKAAVIQYHNFGQYSIELETRIHTAAALIAVCPESNPSDCGAIYTTQFQDYGQRVTPYQGTLLDYPDNFQPVYPDERGPYFTADCVGVGLPGCRPSLAFIRDRNINANSIWTSKPSGQGPRPETSRTFRLLFRIRDTYQVLDSADLAHPFAWLFVCSADGGITYNPAGCRYNNSTTRVHEVGGTIPAEWDTLDGVSDGHVTYEGYTDRYGALAPDCAAPGPDCHPVKLVNVPVGTYSGALPGAKVSNPSPVSNPSRNLWFCAGVVCSETSTGAVPSGWLGPTN